MFNFTPKIDTAQVQQKVQADINNSNSKRWDRNTFIQKIKKYSTEYNVSSSEAYDFLLDQANKQGFIIEGVNDSPEQVQSQVRKNTKKPNKFLNAYDAVGKGIHNIVGGAVSSVPSIAGNIAGFTADVFTPKSKEGFGDTLKGLGQSGKDIIQELGDVDPDAILTGIGEFGAEAGSLFIPGGTSKLISKFPNAVDKIRNLSTAIEKIKKYPKVYKALTSDLVKNGIIHAKEAAKFGIVSKGETNWKEIVIGGTLGLTFGAIGKALKTPTVQELRKDMFDRMGKLATKIAPSRTTAQQIQKNIDKSIDGAFLIRATDPTMKLTGPDAVQNSLELAQQTRKNLLTQMKKARGNGTTNLKPVISWIDDMLEALQKGGKSKLSGTQLDELKELAKMDSKIVIKMLQQQKEELLSPAKSLGGVLDLEDLDNIIIGNNAKLSDLFGKTTNLSENQGVKTIGAINTQLIKLLDNVSGDGKVFRGLKQQYSNVRVYEDNLNKIYAQLLRKKDAGLGDYADVFILSNMGQSLVTGDVSGLAKAGLQKVIKEQVKKQNDVNFVLETLFKKIDRELGIEPSTIAEGVKRVAGTVADKFTGASTVGVAGGIELQNAILD